MASQYNGAESPNTTPLRNGEAESVYSNDRTQGPGAQRMYSKDQVEFINSCVYKGMNGIANVLEEDTKHTLLGGYLIPANSDDAAKVIEQFKKNGHQMVSTCIGNTLRAAKDQETPGERPHKVYMVLSAAPALSANYLSGGNNPTGIEATITQEQKKELSFQTTLWAYRSLFIQGIELTYLPENKGKQVIIKPAALGLGAFENPTEAVAKAYYQAASEYADELKRCKVKVELQIRPESTLNRNKQLSLAEQMATTLLYPPAQSSAKGGGSK